MINATNQFVTRLYRVHAQHLATAFQLTQCAAIGMPFCRAAPLAAAAAAAAAAAPIFRRLQVHSFYPNLL
jgi:hypothetical protein